MRFQAQKPYALAPSIVFMEPIILSASYHSRFLEVVFFTKHEGSPAFIARA
jgi:hypothetical protein